MDVAFHPRCYITWSKQFLARNKNRDDSHMQFSPVPSYLFALTKILNTSILLDKITNVGTTYKQHKFLLLRITTFFCNIRRTVHIFTVTEHCTLLHWHETLHKLAFLQNTAHFCTDTRHYTNLHYYKTLNTSALTRDTTQIGVITKDSTHIHYLNTLSQNTAYIWTITRHYIHFHCHKTLHTFVLSQSTAHICTIEYFYLSLSL